MKQFFTLLMLSLVFGLQAQDGPTPAEIAEAYIETIGGEEAWKSMKAVRLTGKANMQGMEFPVVMTTAAGDRSYMEVDIQGTKMIQAFDGDSTAWWMFPMQGIDKPTEMPAEMAGDMKESYFLPEFIDSEERGFVLEAAEGKELEGTQTVAVRVTNDKGYDKTYYFDAEVMVPVMVASPIKVGPSKGMMTETFFSDYEEMEYGDYTLVMPMFLEVKIPGQGSQKITLEKAELDPEFDDEMFMLKKD